MRFGVLGPLAVWTDDGVPVHVPEPKVRALLAALAGEAGRTVPSDRLVDGVWGGRPPRNPAGTLQARVSQLRGVLEAAEPGARALIEARPPGYVLRVAPDAVDAGRFAALAARAERERDAARRAGLFADALALWRGPAFAEFDDAAFAREAAPGLEERRLGALEGHAEARLELGGDDAGPAWNAGGPAWDAAGAARDAAELAAELAGPVARHPLRERLRAAYLRALYRAGRRGEALAAYEDLRERLADELGADPSPELAALHGAMLRHDPALAGAAEPPKGNLPAAVDELIGRSDAVAAARSLLGSARLVTLTGPGGVGKTRLALETARRSLGDHPGGAWVVELASGRPTTLDGAAELVSAALGIRDEASGPAAGRLAEALRGRRALLVLDNCEHVIEPVAGLAERLLAAAPGLRILATTQEPLGIAGERVQAVPPLEPPAAGPVAATGTLLESSAVRLFVARAAAASPGFVLDDASAPWVASICRRLDGIPLALELAATRVQALGVRELASRLDDRFRVLAGGRRGGPARQQTLRAMIDWSWELLTGPERAVLRRLAVHRDGCALPEAEETCGGDGLDAVEPLARLVDRSLVVAVPDPGGVRYRLLESVAAYGLERLADAGEAETVRRRHARHYAELAERGAAGLRGVGQREWLDRLSHEGANLRAALEWATGAGDADLALRLVNAQSWYWFLRGRYGEAVRSLTLALSMTGEGGGAGRAGDAGGAGDARIEAATWQTGMKMLAREGSPEESERLRRAALQQYGDSAAPLARAWAEWFLSHVHWPYGDLAANEERLNRALATFRAHGDGWGAGAVLGTRSKMAMVRGDLDAMARDAADSLALFDGLGDTWGRLEAMDALDRRAEIAGDHAEAARLRAEGLRLAEDLAMWDEVAFRLAGLGRLALLEGDLDKARDLHERAHLLAVRQSSRSAEEFAEVGLGLTARRAGRLDDAEAHLRSRLGWLRGIGGTTGVAFVLSQLGFVAEERGDAAAALALHGEGLAAARATRDPRAVALALEGLAGARSLAGLHERAARLLGAAEAAREAAGAPLPKAERGDIDRIAARIEAAVGAEALAAGHAAGRAEGPDAHGVPDGVDGVDGVLDGE